MTATQAQQDYIEQLAIDLGLGSRSQRNGYVSLRVNREVKYLDELTVAEASHVIDFMKADKEAGLTY